MRRNRYRFEQDFSEVNVERRKNNSILRKMSVLTFRLPPHPITLNASAGTHERDDNSIWTGSQRIARSGVGEQELARRGASRGGCQSVADPLQAPCSRPAM